LNHSISSEQTRPLWVPSSASIKGSHMAQLIERVAAEHATGVTDYASLYRFSLAHPEAFWNSIWAYADIRGEQGPRFSEAWPDMPGARFYPEGRLNFAENLLRCRDHRIAIEFANEAGDRRQMTYRALNAEVSRVAAGLQGLGIEPGDRVAAYMPNVPETVIAMLATAAIGAVWSSCSPDFGVPGVMDRFGQIKPKVLIAASGYCYNGKTFDCLERVQTLLPELTSVEATIIVPYVHSVEALPESLNAVLWDQLASDHDEPLEFEAFPFGHPLYILYSSGTTGIPKCIVHSAGGTLLQHVKELMLHTDLHRADRFFYYTTCGWMMWNWLVSGLAVESTVVLYDGSPFYPDGHVLWNLIDELDITIFGTSAKWIAACDKAGLKPRESHSLDSLRVMLSTGSPLLPESFDYVYRDVKSDLQLSSISGGTDIVSCFALGNPLLPVYRGELQCRGLGMNVEIRDDQGKVVEQQTGELTCSMPFPSMPIGFWNDPDGQRYQAAYFDTFPNVWSQGDYAELTAHNGVRIFGRSDATLNPGGVRIGTAEIYRQVEQLDEVIESLCVGQQWQDDERVVLFVRLRDGVELDEALQQKIRSHIRQHATPRHVPARILAVTDLPRTVSGKITELAVRDVIHGRPVKNTTALANPEVLEQFRHRPELQS